VVGLHVELTVHVPVSCPLAKGRPMRKDNSSDEYALWVKLAKDPSQPEQLRQTYRAKMEAYVHEQLREAFRLVAEQTPPAGP
jgi:hypothetical protein